MIVYVVTYCYNTDGDIISYANVFDTLECAVKDAKIAQNEFTDGWDGNGEYDEAKDLGLFTCADDNGNSLTIRIEMKRLEISE